MKRTGLINSLLVKKLPELKEASARRKMARIESANITKSVPNIVRASRIARKGTIRLRDELLAGPESQNGSATSYIKRLNHILAHQIPPLERELIIGEIEKWEAQLKNAQKRIKSAQ